MPQAVRRQLNFRLLFPLKIFLHQPLLGRLSLDSRVRFMCLYKYPVELFNIIWPATQHFDRLSLSRSLEVRSSWNLQKTKQRSQCLPIIAHYDGHEHLSAPVYQAISTIWQSRYEAGRLLHDFRLIAQASQFITRQIDRSCLSFSQP